MSAGLSTTLPVLPPLKDAPEGCLKDAGPRTRGHQSERTVAKVARSVGGRAWRCREPSQARASVCGCRRERCPAPSSTAPTARRPGVGGSRQPRAPSLTEQQAQPAQQWSARPGLVSRRRGTRAGEVRSKSGAFGALPRFLHHATRLVWAGRCKQVERRRAAADAGGVGERGEHVPIARVAEEKERRARLSDRVSGRRQGPRSRFRRFLRHARACNARHCVRGMPRLHRVQIADARV
jgi:hypothetical protein